ncbi:hypothetical protein ISCGN_006210, partial [Ixodes scapularis]
EPWPVGAERRGSPRPRWGRRRGGRLWPSPCTCSGLSGPSSWTTSSASSTTTSPTPS